MHKDVDGSRVLAFLTEFGRRCRGHGAVYLVGGATAVLHGVFVLAFALPTTAFADPLESLDRAQAGRAAAMLESTNVAHLFCASCGDERSTVLRYAEVAVAQVEADVFEVWLDGVAVTLGDLYVERAGRYTNVARLAEVRASSGPAVLPAERIGTEPAPPAPPPVGGAPGPRVPLDARCVLERDARTVRRICRDDAGRMAILEGDAVRSEPARLGGRAGAANVEALEFVNGEGMLMVTRADGAPIFSRGRWALAGQRFTFEEVLSNGADVLELVIREGDEDGTVLVVVAALEDALVVVLEASTGGGMAQPGFSRAFTFDAARGTARAAVIEGRGTRRVENYRFDASERRFVRVGGRAPRR